MSVFPVHVLGALGMTNWMTKCQNRTASAFSMHGTLMPRTVVRSTPYILPETGSCFSSKPGLAAYEIPMAAASSRQALCAGPRTAGRTRTASSPLPLLAMLCAVLCMLCALVTPVTAHGGGAAAHQPGAFVWLPWCATGQCNRKGHCRTSNAILSC